MQRIDRDDQRILDTLDTDHGFCRHPLEHGFCLVQRDDRGIPCHAGGTVCCFVDLRHPAGKSLIPDRTDGDISTLPEFQGEDLALIHIYRHLHADIRRKRDKCGLAARIGSILIILNTADGTAVRSEHCSVPVQFHQFEQCLFQFGTLIEQRLIPGVV